MKSKIYLIILSLSLLLLSCNSDPQTSSCFIYKNAYDKAITIEAFHLDSEKNPVKDASFVIEPGNEHQVLLYSVMGRPSPFGWDGGDVYSTAYSVISDGERQVIQQNDWGKLFHYYYYEVIIIKKSQYYRYTFTAEDFKDAIPMKD